MKRDRLYLEQILECVRRIEQFTKDGREFFLATPLVQDAVIRNLQILAERSLKTIMIVFFRHCSEVTGKNRVRLSLRAKRSNLVIEKKVASSLRSSQRHLVGLIFSQFATVSFFPAIAEDYSAEMGTPTIPFPYLGSLNSISAIQRRVVHKIDCRSVSFFPCHVDANARESVYHIPIRD